jgi:tetratricopeptide (TPR) repeat protein
MLEDIFAVQDDIARSVVKELRTALLGEEADSDASGAAKADVARAARGRGTDPEAHRLYLLARHLIDRLTREDTAKAVAYFEEALALDPAFALGWVELSRANSKGAGFGWIPQAEGWARAREAVERALSLEPDLAEGHAQMAGIRMYYDWDWRGAETSMRRALELARGNASVLRIAAVLAGNLGHVEEAIRLCRQAVEQDPLSAASYHNLGLHPSGRLAEAEAAYRKALELAPQMTATRAYLSLILMAQGRDDEAMAEAQREPEEALRLWALAILNHGMNHRAASDAALQELIAKCADEAPYQIAEVYAARGEGNEAFEWLERAYAQRDGGLSEMKSSPRLRSLHGDPRWGQMLHKMGLE